MTLQVIGKRTVFMPKASPYRPILLQCERYICIGAALDAKGLQCQQQVDIPLVSVRRR